MLRHIPHINPIDEDFAGSDIIETRYQIDKGSFTTASAADDRRSLAGFRGKGDMF